MIRLAGLLAVWLFASCDSGDIVDDGQTAAGSGRAVKLTARVSGIRALGSGYVVSLAAFRSGDNYASTVRAVSSSTEDGTDITLILSPVSSEVSTVEFAVTDRLRQRIVTLARLAVEDYPEQPDTIRMDLGAVDVSAFSVLQSGVFNVACIQCHGGNGGSGAAGLNLTEGQALPQLVDMPSTCREGMLRVAGGDARRSVLHQILSEGGENILHVNHTEILSNQFRENVVELRSFIAEWINNLSVENRE